MLTFFKCLLFILVLGRTSYAQVADLSFASDRATENSALPGKRSNSFFFVGLDHASEKADLISIVREISMNRFESLYSRPHSLFVPELYLQYGEGSNKTTNSSGVVQSEFDQKVGLIQVNVANKGAKDFHFGVHVSQLLSFNEGGTFGALSYGLGTSLDVGRTMTIGGFYKTYPSSDPENSADADQWSLGLSWLYGNPKSRAFRLEASYGFMSSLAPESVGEENRVPGEVLSLSLEAAFKSFLTGLRVKQTSGVFLDSKTVLKDILYSSDRPLDEPIVIYEAFFSFRAKRGGSFGLSGFYFKGNQETFLSGGRVLAKVESTSASLSYSHQF